MRILKSIRILALIILIIGCAKVDDQVYVEPDKELSSTKASGCRSSLVFNSTPVTRSLPFSGYNNTHNNAFAFDGTMYAKEEVWEGEGVIGTEEPGAVWWYSNDGIEWSKVRLPKSLSHKMVELVVFKKQLWCLEQRSDGHGWRVWRLADSSFGIYKPTWQRVSSNSEHPSLTENLVDSEYIVFNDKIWHFKASHTSSGVFVRSSTDMINWETTLRPWSETFPHSWYATFIVFDGKIWMIGGWTEGYSWFSNDGINWTEASSGRLWDLSHHDTVVYDDKLWVIGGVDGGRNAKNDVWVSKDGQDWSMVTRYNPAPFPPKANHSAVIFKNKLWIIGGNIGHSVGSNREVWNMQKCSNSTFGPTKGK